MPSTSVNTEYSGLTTESRIGTLPHIEATTTSVGSIL
eukprot:XP_001704301.1 Hypothetical protein GL50803_11643 [Giardia lamblia ATCC 50803]